VAYTADLDTLVQRRQAKPYTERAIRRVVLAGAPQIAAMDQIFENFNQEIAQCKQQMMSDLRGVVAVFKSCNVKQGQWECCTDSGWVAYSAALSALLEAGYKVYAIFTHIEVCKIYCYDRARSCCECQYVT
jgi:hypothetical protein